MLSRVRPHPPKSRSPLPRPPTRFGNLRGNRSVSSGAPRREGDPRGAVQTGTAGPKFLGLPRSRPVTNHADRPPARPPRRAATRAIRRTRLFSGGEEPCSLFGSLRRDGSLVRPIFLMVAAPTREPSLIEPDQKVARDHHPRGAQQQERSRTESAAHQLRRASSMQVAHTIASESTATVSSERPHAEHTTVRPQWRTPTRSRCRQASQMSPSPSISAGAPSVRQKRQRRASAASTISVPVTCSSSRSSAIASTWRPAAS